MNGVHDMGGMQCFGRVIAEADEPIFHHDWEKRALALTVAMGFTGAWNLDMSRFARESLTPDFYLSKTYYQIWIHGLQNLMLERGMIDQGELDNGEAELPAVEIRRKVVAEEVPAILAIGGPVERDLQISPKFQIGDKITTLNINPSGHTRLPRYARGKQGAISGLHGIHVFPDSNAKGEGENPQWLYSVRFEARELFGPTAEENGFVMVDCWEPYLE